MHWSRLVVVLLVLLSGTTAAELPRYSFGGGVGFANLTGGDFFSYDWENNFRFTAGHRLGERWLLSLDVSFLTLDNDRDADSTGTVDGITNNQPLEFRSTRLGFQVDRLLLNPYLPVNVKVGLGGGALFWKMVDVESNTTLTVTGDQDGTTDFAATELILTGGLGLVVMPSRNISLNIDGRADYLTHGGAEFSDDVRNTLDRWLLGASATLNFHFGGGDSDEPIWVSDSAWNLQRVERSSARRQPGTLDGDLDGVADDVDRCLNTPRNVPVDRNGCPLDGDRDGVPDGLDHCPSTPAAAAGQVDLYGCPLDSDFDGVADFVDRCPNNRIGAWVDADGCPVDSDADGVPDGLDDCPHTLVGVTVDRNGCIDLAQFAEPMVLNIDYPSGGFEIDPNNQERVRDLARVLTFVTDLKLEIHGFTDNIGTSTANRRLSEKRANRVKQFLVSQGVAAARIKVFGRGEENPVASNDTAEGRAKNRRIEIIFYR
jgi:outer membrane protein OmpA-like peptidoglycan-associated protein